MELPLFLCIALKYLLKSYSIDKLLLSLLYEQKDNSIRKLLLKIFLMLWIKVRKKKSYMDYSY